MEQLRQLDASATKPGTIISLIVGIIGTLIMGTGMSCVLVLTDYFIPGIIIGIIGMVGVGVAFPLYTSITKKQREKIAPQIKALSDELMEQL